MGQLRSAADDVAALLRAGPHRTASFTLVAIDNAVPPEEPLVGEVMKILERRWQSYAGAFADATLPTVARALILHALSKTLSLEPIAAAVSLTTRSVLPLIGDRGDRDLWVEILSDADRRLAQRAEREWALPSAASAAETGLSPTAPTPLTAPSMNRDWLAQRLDAAAGPNNAAGEALKSANQNLPNAGQVWSNFFSGAAATAIAAGVDSVVDALVERLNEQSTGEKLTTAISDYVSATATAVARTAVGLERRTSLIWWKEALFSPAAQCSYRDLAPSVAAALAAIDASNQTGPFAPRMAEAMVRETLRAVCSADMTVARPLLEHGRTVRDSPENVRNVLASAYGAIHCEPGRSPLGAVLMKDGGLTAEAVAARLGLAPDLEISAIDLGVWLFRDLQAAAATPEPSRRRRAVKAS